MVVKNETKTINDASLFDLRLENVNEQSYPVESATSSNLINGSAVALLGFLFLLSQTQVIYNIIVHYFYSSLYDGSLPKSSQREATTSNIFNSDYSIIGIHAGSAVGLLGLLLFINLLRVWNRILNKVLEIVWWVLPILLELNIGLKLTSERFLNLCRLDFDVISFFINNFLKLLSLLFWMCKKAF